MTTRREQDRRRLREAEGWLELGGAAEALGQLDQISSREASHIDVLRARYTALASTGQWNCALLVSEVAVHMFPAFPETWLWRAHAVRAVTKSAEKARDCLSQAGEMFPDDPIVLLNLALYESELRHTAKAATWLKKSREAAGTPQNLELVGRLVEQDESLRRIWQRLGAN